MVVPAVNDCRREQTISTGYWVDRSPAGGEGSKACLTFHIDECMYFLVSSSENLERSVS